MTGVAVNVTLVPGQILVELAAMLTLTGRFGFTVIVIELEVAGFPVGHVAFDVRTHVTISPFAKLEFEYVEEFGPTLLPFNFH